MENLVVSANKKITIEKYVSQVKIITQNIVKKVLSVKAQNSSAVCECQGGVVSISGKIKVDVLYITLENTIERATGETDFIEKQKSSFDLMNTFVNDNLSVADVNFSSNEIICSVTHSTEIIGVYRYELPNFDNDDGEVVAEKISLESTKFVCFAEDNFSVAEENDTNLRDIQILKSNATAIIDDVVCSVDKIVVEGRILSELIYQDGENISSSFKQIDFKQEIQAENTVPNMKANAYITIKSANITFEENADKYNLIYNFDVSVKGYVFESYNYEIASDIFMLSSEISTTYDYIETKNYVDMVEQSESLLSQTDITSINDFDDIVGVFEPNIEIVRIENNEDRADVFAKISAYALYSCDNGIEKIDINENIKFEILKDGDKLVDQAKAICEIVSFKVKAGKEIEVVFKANCHANIARVLSAKYVKSYEVLSDKMSEESGIKVYIARQDQTIFDVAKALNVKPELILAQNQVEDVFEAGQKVYVYSPINLS